MNPPPREFILEMLKPEECDTTLGEAKWASLVAETVKNLPAVQETPVWFLGWKDPLEKG